MKLLLTANTAWNLANFRAGLIRALQEDGHRLVALAPSDKGAGRLEGMGVPVLPLVMDNKGTAPGRDLKLAADFRRAFLRERPDLVLSYTIKNNIYGGLAARLTGVPFLPNVSGLGTAFLTRGWLEQVVVTLYRGAFRPLPSVMFQNADDREHFLSRQIVAERQTVLLPGSGIDLDAFRPAPAPPPPGRDRLPADRPALARQGRGGVRRGRAPGQGAAAAGAVPPSGPL